MLIPAFLIEQFEGEFMHEFMFTPGMLVCHVTDPSKVGTITGQVRARSPHALWEVAFSHGETKFVSAVYLKAVSTDKKSAMQLLKDREFGRPHDLRRRMTFEKLKGTLSEFIYSMDAAEIDFLPYQYKPVLKFIESPTERLLIADVCVFDAERYWKVERSSLLSQGKNTPYSGLELKGRVTHTLVGGQVAYEVR